MKRQEAIDIVADCIRRRIISVTYAGPRPKHVLTEVLRQDPKLVCNFSQVKEITQNSGTLFSGPTYTLQFTYDADLLPYEDIVLDDGKWCLSAAWKAGMRRDVYMVSTHNVAELDRRLHDDQPELERVCPSFRECSISYAGTRYTAQMMVRITCKYALPLNEQGNMDAMAKHAMDQIFRNCFGNGSALVLRLPEHVRAYLPYSYIQQHVDFVEQPLDPHDATYDAAADTVYSVLTQRRGSALGIAQTYKAMAERLHLTCEIVSGHAGTGDSLPPHTWCMVKAGTGYHHVDPSYGINGNVVCVDGFLQSDRAMKSTHLWDKSAYPACTLRTPGCYEVREYIETHFNDMLNAGIDEECINPDNADW